MCKRPADRAGRAGRVGRADRPFFCIALVLLRAYKRRRSGRQERTGRGDRKGRSRSDMHGVGFPTRLWQLLRSIGADRFFFFACAICWHRCFLLHRCHECQKNAHGIRIFLLHGIRKFHQFGIDTHHKTISEQGICCILCCRSLCVSQKMRLSLAVVAQR